MEDVYDLELEECYVDYVWESSGHFDTFSRHAHGEDDECPAEERLREERYQLWEDI